MKTTFSIILLALLFISFSGLGGVSASSYDSDSDSDSDEGGNGNGNGNGNNGNGNGNGNNGNGNKRVKQSKEFQVFMDMSKATEPCFDFNTFCYEYFKEDFTVSPYNGTAFAQAWITVAALCQVGSEALARTSSFLRAKGSFDIVRRGSNGKVKKVNMTMSFETATVVFAQIKTEAEINTNGTSGGYAATSLEELCVWLSEYYGETSYYHEYICGNANSVAEPFGQMRANAYTTSFGYSEAGIEATFDTSVYVRGRNIQEFTAAVGAGAGGFAVVQLDSIADSYADAYERLYTQAEAGLCRIAVESQCEIWCSEHWAMYHESEEVCVDVVCTLRDTCDEYDWAAALADVYAFGHATGSAWAGAYEKSFVHVAAKAHFKRNKCEDANDLGGLDDFYFESESDLHNTDGWMYCGTNIYEKYGNEDDVTRRLRGYA